MSNKIENLIRSTTWPELVAVDSTEVTFVLDSVCAECPVVREGKGLDRCCEAPDGHVWVTVKTAKILLKKLNKVTKEEDEFKDLLNKVEKFIEDSEDVVSNEDIIKKFSSYKLKQVKKAIKELQ
jgi:hypothetical protein